MANLLDVLEMDDGTRELLEATGQIEVKEDAGGGSPDGSKSGEQTTGETGTNTGGDGDEASKKAAEDAAAAEAAAAAATAKVGADGALGDAKKTIEEIIADATDELKSQLRELDGRFGTLQRQYDRSQKLLKDANIITEDTIQQEKADTEAYKARDNYLGELLEVMRVSPKYEDIDQVVSQNNFDDMIEIMAKAICEGDSTLTVTDVRQGLKEEIWAKPNPYRFMYETIKTYHPKYREATGTTDKGTAKPDAAGSTTTEGEKKDESAGKTATQVVKDAATSLQDVGGAGAVQDAVWTAAKIDALPEDEIGKVPELIWNQYMLGTLK
jgi:hypothetical protein